MSIQISEVQSKSDFNRFLDFAWGLYKGYPHWIPPLRLERKEVFSPKHPFFENARIKSFLASKDGEVKGRITAIVNEAHNKFHNEKCGFFGFFEAINDQEVAHTLFETAEKYLKEQGMEIVRGPMNFSTNHDCGLLIKGFDDPPQIMMPYNPPYFEKLIENENYARVMDLLAYHLPATAQLPERILRIAEKAEHASGITYRKINMKNWDNEVKLMFEIYNDAWEKNWGFIPMTWKEFAQTGKDLKLVINPDLVLFVEVKGEAVGFIVSLPDFNQVLKKIPSGRLFPTGIFHILRAKKYMNRFRIITMGVKKKYRNLGLASLMYKQIQKVVLEIPGRPYVEAEMSWILENNKDMNSPLIQMGAQAYKTYRIYEKKI